MKVVSIVGNRPQFIKAVPLARALAEVADHVLVHTGQHYDDELSAVFFEELGLGVPFILAGVWLPSVLATTRGLRDHWGTVTRVSGAVLIVAGVLLASGRLTDLTARLAG